MMKNDASVLLVAKPSRMRDGLRALLRTIPHLKIVGQADDSPSALALVAEQRPALVLIGANLPHDEVQAVLTQTKAECPEARCIVLVDSFQRQWLAETAGADSVLLTGFPAAKFVGIIEEMLSLETI
jgi:DNA-binding NarL/FixJ family response regulator